jgi:hypothetical protein
MKALLVLAIVLMGAATAFADGFTDLADVAVTAPAWEWGLTEPLAMLLSGGLLLVLAGAVRRLPA